MQEADYERVTYGITLAAAQMLVRLNPGMTFIYTSGVGTDSSEKGQSMWGRVKGRTENALLRLPFKDAYMFRPGAIQAMYGARSKTPLYQAFYVVLNPLLGLMRRIFPNVIVTTEQIGLAMLNARRRGAPKRVLEPKDIRQLAL